MRDERFGVAMKGFVGLKSKMYNFMIQTNMNPKKQKALIECCRRWTKI